MIQARHCWCWLMASGLLLSNPELWYGAWSELHPLQQQLLKERAMLTPLPSPVLTQMEILKQGRGPSTESLISTVAWPRHGGLQMNAKVEAPPASKEGKAEVLGLSFRVSIQISKVDVLEMK